MGDRLLLADYSDSEWGEIELSENWASYRAFWAAVLQFAAADGADAVAYCPELGEDCLSTRVDGKPCIMNPPPEEYRRDLLAAARWLAAGGAMQAYVRRWRQWIFPATGLGTIDLETPGGKIEWRVSGDLKGLILWRMTKNYGAKSDGRTNPSESVRRRE